MKIINETNSHLEPIHKYNAIFLHHHDTDRYYWFSRDEAIYMYRTKRHIWTNIEYKNIYTRKISESARIKCNMYSTQRIGIANLIFSNDGPDVDSYVPVITSTVEYPRCLYFVTTIINALLGAIFYSTYLFLILYYAEDTSMLMGLMIFGFGLSCTFAPLVLFISQRVNMKLCNPCHCCLYCMRRGTLLC